MSVPLGRQQQTCSYPGYPRPAKFPRHLLHQGLNCRGSLSALARLSAALVALLGDRGDVGDKSARLGESIRPFRAAERERFHPRTLRLNRFPTQLEQQPAAKLPKQRSVASSMAMQIYVTTGFLQTIDAFYIFLSMNFFSQNIWLSNTREWLSLLHFWASFQAGVLRTCEFNLEPNCFSHAKPEDRFAQNYPSRSATSMALKLLRILTKIAS